MSLPGELPADLLALAAELVRLPSLSRQEGLLADRVEAALRARPELEVVRVGDNVVARTSLGRPRRVVLAGHLDTVPGDPSSARIEGDWLRGLGAADMKGGLAVLLDLARTFRASPATVDVTWCFYAREEVARAESGLVELWSARPDLLAADVAILGEPTDGRVEAGCQGTLRAAVRLGGVRAHTARPYEGRNAIHRLGPVLERVSGWPGRTVAIDGCDYVEQLQAVAVTGGVAGNVVPDAAEVALNYRYAPDRWGEEPRAWLSGQFDGLLDQALGDEVDVVDQADGAPPGLHDPLLGELVRLTGEPPRAKVGWTDVATFFEHGIPATNFGPGDPLLAHHPDERVSRASLERARAVLGALVTGSG